MAHFFAVLTFSAVWFMDVNKAQCRYVSIESYVYPIDSCAIEFTFFDTTFSTKYECASDGSVHQLQYNRSNCAGTPLSDMTTSATDYNCDGSTSDCQVVTMSQEYPCDATLSLGVSHSYQAIVVANRCPAAGGYQVNCNDGNDASRRLSACETSFFPFNTTQAPDPCTSISSCYKGSIGSSAGETLSVAGLSTAVLIGVAVGAIVYCVLVLCCLRSCCKTTSNVNANVNVHVKQNQELATVTAGNKPARTNYDPIQPAPTPFQYVQPAPLIAPATRGGDVLPSYAEALPSYGDAVTASAPMVVSVDAALPPGWIQMTTPDGRIYFQNNATKQTQWTRPEAERPLPAGWRKEYAENGRVYFLNDITKRTQWEFPSAPAVANNDPPAYTPNAPPPGYYDDGYAPNAPPPEAYAMDVEQPGFDRMETPQNEGAGGYTNQ